MDLGNKKKQLARRASDFKKKREKIRKSGARYTFVIHNARIELGLSINEFCLADSINKLSSHHSPVPGWCIMSKEKLGDSLGLSRRSIHNMLNTLKEKTLVEVHPQTNHIRTTKKWHNAVEIYKDEVFGDK